MLREVSSYRIRVNWYFPGYYDGSFNYFCTAFVFYSNSHNSTVDGPYNIELWSLVSEFQGQFIDYRRYSWRNS